MSLEKRRYKVVGMKLEKVWTGQDDDGWVRTKAEAYANAEKNAPKNTSEQEIPAAEEDPPKRGPGRPRKVETEDV